MDASECLAGKYLRSLNKGAAVYEPQRNVPPDFCLSGQIGVEVRRLNQNFEYTDGSHEGLENLFFPTMSRFKRLLGDFGSLDGESWYVGIIFHRPLESWTILRPLVEIGLREFMGQPIRAPKAIEITGI